MLDINYIRENKESVHAGLTKRGWNSERISIVDQLILLDDQRKSTQTTLDSHLADRNRFSKEIGALMKGGKKEEAEKMKLKVAAAKTEAEKLQTELSLLEEQIEDHLLSIPNIPNAKVPAGTSEEDNEVYQEWHTTVPYLGHNSLPHWELAKKYNLIDFELGAFITGSGFPLFRGKGARLQRALINFFLDEAIQAGYEEIMPPLMVNEASARGTGQIPDKEGQMYYMEKDDLYLIPTAEVPITNIYRDKILSEEDFPIKMCGHTPCFRREAGSYGSDVKGLNRVHQFEKVEIVRIEHPDYSYNILYEMLDHVKTLLEKLELPYRILTLCGGDLGFTSALTYDFEVFSAAQEKWLEVSSVSNFETYQSRRLKLRFNDENGKKHFAHTLNGSALALARIIAAILENNQTPEGIKIPKALHSYTGFEMIS